MTFGASYGYFLQESYAIYRLFPSFNTSLSVNISWIYFIRMRILILTRREYSGFDMNFDLLHAESFHTLKSTNSIKYSDMTQLIYDIRFSNLEVKNRNKFSVTSVSFFPPSSSSPCEYVFSLGIISMCSFYASLKNSLFIRCSNKRRGGEKRLLKLW